MREKRKKEDRQGSVERKSSPSFGLPYHLREHNQRPHSYKPLILLLFVFVTYRTADPRDVGEEEGEVIGESRDWRGEGNGKRDKLKCYGADEDDGKRDEGLGGCGMILGSERLIPVAKKKLREIIII